MILMQEKHVIPKYLLSFCERLWRYAIPYNKFSRDAKKFILSSITVYPPLRPIENYHCAFVFASTALHG